MNYENDVFRSAPQFSTFHESSCIQSEKQAKHPHLFCKTSGLTKNSVVICGNRKTVLYSYTTAHDFQSQFPLKPAVLTGVLLPIS